MKSLTMAGLVCVAAMIGVGCGDAMEFDPEDLDLEVSSQELTFYTSTFTLTSYKPRLNLLEGIVYEGPPDPEEAPLYTFSLRSLSFAGLRTTTSYRTASTRSAAPAGGTCGNLAKQWSKVLNRKDWSAAKKRKRIIKVLLPKMANNKCTANITYVEGANGVNQVKKISPGKPNRH